MTKKKTKEPGAVGQAKLIDEILAGIRTDFPGTTIGRGSDPDIKARLDYAKYPYGIDSLDALLEGGVPAGKFTIHAGPPGSGKSTSGFQVIANYLENHPGKFAVIDDAENALDEKWLAHLGVDTSRVIVIPGDRSMEDQLDELIHTIHRAKEMVGIVMVDSVGAMTPKIEFEGKKDKRAKKDDAYRFTMDQDSMAVVARKLGQFLRVANVHLTRYGAACILVTHVYADLSQTGGGRLIPKGGNAMKHFGHVMLEFRAKSDEAFEEKILCPDGEIRETRTGFWSIIRVEKSKQSGAQYKQVHVPFRVGIGFDTVTAMVHSAVGYGVIERSGSWYNYQAEKLGQGVDRVLRTLSENPALRLKIRAHLTRVMGEQGVFERGQSPTTEIEGLRGCDANAEPKGQQVD